MHPHSPLPPHLINLTLQYLLPPAPPLPPHLLAKELLQRHHFLNITPDEPASYFCWPVPSSTSNHTSSTSPEDVMRDLELLAGNSSILEREEHNITYESDGEIARVRVSSSDNIYVLFRWQNEDELPSQGEAGWRYFDTKRILPSNSSEPIAHTVLSHGLEEAENDLTRSSSPSSDAYWDNYGAGSSQDSPSHIAHPLPATSDNVAAEDEEAAYWKQYASVQGTADSTIPSPRMSRKPSRNPQSVGGIYDPNFITPHEYQGWPSDDMPLDTQDEGRVLGTYILTSFPDDANDTQADLIARALMPVQAYQEVTGESPPRKALQEVDILLSPISPAPDMDDVINDSLSFSDAPPSSEPSIISIPPELERETHSSEGTSVTPPDLGSPEMDEGLADMARGMYKLWLAGRGSSPSGAESPDPERRTEFLAVVAKALA